MVKTAQTIQCSRIQMCNVYVSVLELPNIWLLSLVDMLTVFILPVPRFSIPTRHC